MRVWLVVVISAIAVASAWLPGDPLPTWLALLVSVAGAVVLAARARLTPGRYDLAVGLFCAGLLVGAVRAGLQPDALAALRTYLAVVAGYYLIRSAPGRRAGGAVVSLLLLGCTAAAVAAVYFWAGAAATKVTTLDAWLRTMIRETIPLTWLPPAGQANLNVAAIPLAVALAFLYVAVLRFRGAARLGALALCGATVVALVIASSRAGWLGGAAALVACSALVGAGLRMTTVAVGTAFVSLLVLAPAVAPDLTDPFDLFGRLELWATLTPRVLDEMPTGVGLGLLPFEMRHFLEGVPASEVPSNPHNAWLQLAADAGALGLAAFLVAAFAFVRDLASARQSNGIFQAAAAALVGYGVVSVFESGLVLIYRTGPDAFVYLASPLPWVLLALLGRERRRGGSSGETTADHGGRGAPTGVASLSCTHHPGAVRCGFGMAFAEGMRQACVPLSAPHPRAACRR